ncbi:MAG: hypothetical protein AMQ74_00648 [Candidatus Methanofastidiosum methylothiophilum]|uniref:ArnR1-like winged helix-turn-helix domain-containing protein n=1 Tax=Candidatus Methanofastidiosum methylothiophilum TaxID=1705564 RepID=A0A150J610_9EURY|nr:MAG: hypothetical protein AMQ74_00648 [Candidatus Methanofastidiosum methylthiophilus]
MEIEYRASNKIILNIMECIIKKSTSTNKALKTHIIQCANLKAEMADKYFAILKEAGYIVEKEGTWGKRKVIYYELTEKGVERYKWFFQINKELYGV